MVRHWRRHIQAETGGEDRHRVRSHLVVNTVGACVTGLVLLVVLVTKFTQGAWVVCVAIPVLWLVMRRIRRHYATVRAHLSVPAEAPLPPPPSGNVAVVLVANTLLPTLRALSYARATRPDALIVLTANVDDVETE